MSCSSNPIARTEYVKQTIPESPAEPDYYPVVWQKVGEFYCVDQKNAKNLLKNWELSKEFVEQHREILEGLR